MRWIYRRDFLAGSLSLIGRADAETRSHPFPLGIASGEPSPDGVVLWTRLLPDDPHHPIEIKWELYGDESARIVVRKDTAVAGADW